MAELRYLSFWIVRGATEISPAGEHLLFASSGSQVRVLLTSDLEGWSEHLDRSASIRDIIFAVGLGDTPEQAIRRQQTLEAVRAARRKAYSKGVFLILDAKKRAADIPAEYRRVDDFGVTIDAFDNDAVRDELRPFLTGAVAAILVALPGGSDRRVEPIGAAVFSVDPADDRHVYNFNIRMGSPTLSINGVLNAGRIPEIVRYATFLAVDEALSKVTRLLLASAIEQEPYGRFLLSWTALEMFVNTTFSETYEGVAIAARADGASPLGQAMRPHLRDGSDGFPLRTRFAAIAHSLASGDFAADSKEFAALKSLRDGFVHRGDQPPNVEDFAKRSRDLLLKFLGLQLDARACS